MKLISIYIFFLFVSSNVYAETGYIYETDFNGDGINDSLRSGPKAMFGNAGGPYMLSLSRGDGTFSQKIIRLHPLACALEMNGKYSRIWSYWRSSAGTGSLSYIMLDGTFKEKSISMYFSGDGTSLSRQLYDLIFEKNKIIKFKEIENYSPPKYEWGK